VDRKIDTTTVKRLLWPSISLALSIAAVVLVVLAGRASASSITSDGVGVPLPQPTIPPTAVHGSPTAAHGSPTPQSTAVATVTIPGPRPTGQPTAPSCNMSFSDVQPSDWFYLPVDWMYCNGIVSGYSDGTFRPNNPTTRGQMAKIAVGAFGLPIHTDGGPHFTDVAPSSTYYNFVESVYFYGVVGGYPCGGLSEPCDSQARPYFRPNSQVTRGQLTKITVLTAIVADPSNWHLLNPPTPSFADVAPGNTFYPYVETAFVHNLFQGYACGGPGEPCPGNYFRPGHNATRAQLSKIVYGAVTQH
jgi:hypothetical protein